MLTWMIKLRGRRLLLVLFKAELVVGGRGGESNRNRNRMIEGDDRDNGEVKNEMREMEHTPLRWLEME